jgi:hypothetical protein
MELFKVICRDVASGNTQKDKIYFLILPIYKTPRVINRIAGIAAE